ncbi:hypothetical protein ACHAWT_010724 [Skeletonema menzelii]
MSSDDDVDRKVKQATKRSFNLAPFLIDFVTRLASSTEARYFHETERSEDDPLFINSSNGFDDTTIFQA